MNLPKYLQAKSNLKRTFKKTMIIGYMTAALAASGIFSQTVLAGPADDASLGTQNQGPGQQGPSGPTTPVVPTYVNPQYYDKAPANQVVNPVDLYSYEQMERDIQALASRYGSRMTINVIGQSLDGRNIYDVVVGNPGASRQLLFQGAIHAREYITVPLMMQQLEYLLANYDNGYYNDIPLRDLMNNTAFHFVPMANPDGVSISQFGESAIRSESLRQMIQACYAVDTAEQRTTLPYDQYLRRWKSNGIGVDLNHNFDAGWEQLNPTLSHNSSTDFKGTAPLSEPEAQALANLSNQYRFNAVINYHAMGNVIYWNTENNRELNPSLDLAQRVSANNGYTILGSLGVGGYKDWLQRRDNSVPSITIELGRSTAPVSFSEYPSLWEQNKMVPGIALAFVNGR